MKLLLAVELTQWILFGVLLLVIVAMPFFMRARNKREMERAQMVIDSIKKGDKVLTSAGIIGKVVAFDEKEGYKTITIETGDEKHKGYLTFDIAAVYMNLSAPVQVVPVAEEVKPEVTEVVEVETQEVQIAEEQPKQPKTKKTKTK